jgi:hypothetical protein
VDLNLRAQFLKPGGCTIDENGKEKCDNATILTPDFHNVDTGTSPSTAGDVPGTSPGVPGTGGDTAVPEPTSLILLGSGLAYAGSRLRRRRSE